MLEAAVNHLQESTTSLTELKDHLKKEFQSQYLEKNESLMKQEVQLAGKLFIIINGKEHCIKFSFSHVIVT